MDTVGIWLSRVRRRIFGPPHEYTPEEVRGIRLRIASSLEGPGAVEEEKARQSREIELETARGRSPEGE